MEGARWYIVHTYSGYENKVKTNIEKAIMSRHMEDQILEVRVPLQDVEEIRNGTRKTVQRKIFPGYVFVNMVYNDETWYVVRNTRGVTGFVGPESAPVPIEEYEMMAKPGAPVEVELDYEIGDKVVVIDGFRKDTDGIVKAIDRENEMVTIVADMFGGETDITLGFTEVKKLN
jgi:transcriptional antiterminator NusG